MPTPYCAICQAISDPSLLCPACRQAQAMLPDPAHAMRNAGSPRRHAREDNDDDDGDEKSAKKKNTSSGAGAGAAVGAAAGMGIGMILLIVGGISVCCLGVCGGGALVLVPAVQKVREAAERTTRTNDLRQIGMGAHTFANINQGILPSPQMQPQQPGGKAPALSWRVSILPFVEENPLFTRFDKSQDWNGGANNNLLNLMPPVYGKPESGRNPNETAYQYFTGQNTLFPTPLTKAGLNNIPDGSSQTLLAAEANVAVPWTKPADMVVPANGPLPIRSGDFLALFADGSVRVIRRQSASDEILRMAIDPKDGKPLPGGWDN